MLQLAVMGCYCHGFEFKCRIKMYCLKLFGKRVGRADGSCWSRVHLASRRKLAFHQRKLLLMLSKMRIEPSFGVRHVWARLESLERGNL